MTNSAVATWKESIDLATLASRLSKERVQLDTPDKDREVLSTLPPETQAIYKVQYLEVSVNSIKDDLPTIGKLEIMKRAAQAHLCRIHLVIFRWIQATGTGTINDVVNAFWTPWQSTPCETPTTRASRWRFVVGQVHIAVLLDLVENSAPVWKSMPKDYIIPTSEALLNQWNRMHRAASLGTSDPALISRNLYGILGNLSDNSTVRLTLPSWSATPVMKGERITRAIASLLCGLIETEFIFVHTKDFTEDAPNRLRHYGNTKSMLKTRTLLRGEILSQMVDAYKGHGILYTNAAKNVLYYPERIIASPSRENRLTSILMHDKFPSIFQTPPPPSVITRLAEIQKIADEFVDSIANLGKKNPAATSNDGYLTSDALRLSSLPWENTELYTARWEMASIMLQEGARYNRGDRGESCMVSQHHDFLSGVVRRKTKKGVIKKVTFDTDNVHPFRSLNAMTDLLRQYYMPSNTFTKETGLAELLIFHGHGHGDATRAALLLLQPPYGSFTNVVNAFSHNYHEKISNINVWGTPAAGMSHTATLGNPKKRKRKDKNGKKVNITVNKIKKDINDRLSIFWNASVIAEWRELLQTHDMLNADVSTVLPVSRPSWKSFYALMKKLALPGFSHDTLTLMQLANTLTIFNIIEPPTLEDTARLIIDINRGAVAGLRFLGFPCRTNAETSVAFVTYYRWCEANMDPATRSRTQFNPGMAEHGLCKLGRWEKFSCTSTFPLMTLTWLDTVRDKVFPWAPVYREVLASAMAETAPWNF